MQNKKLSLDTIPNELQLKIFEYGMPCKREKNFIINKQITKLLSKKFKKCKPYHMLNTFICKNCDKHAFMFMQYLGCSFV